MNPSPRAQPARPQLPPVDSRLDSFVSDVIGDASARTGYTYKLGEGSRTPAQQAGKVAAGYSKTYHSKHLSGRGRDVLAYDSSGAYITDGSHDAYKALGDVYRERAPAAGVSVRWGGDFKDFYDPGHFEIDDDESPAPALKLDGVLEPPLKLDGILEPVDTEEVVSVNPSIEGATGKPLALNDPRRKARPDASEMPPVASSPPPPLPQPETYDLRTMEGRASRDARQRAERTPGAYLEAVLPVSDITKVDAREAVREMYKQAVVSRGVPAEFFDKWQTENNPTGYHISDRPGGTELTASDAHDDASKGLRLRLDATHVSKIVDDYKASRGTFKKLGDWVSTDEESSGEKVLEAAGTVAKPVGVALDYGTRWLRAGSASFWAGYNSGSPSEAVGAAWNVYKGEDPGPVANNALAEGVRHNQTLGRINPRLPRLLGGITEAVADPANLIPLGMIAKAGRLAEGARALGMVDRGLVEARPLGLLEETAARELAHAPDDLLRSAGYTVERIAAPNRTAAGAAPEVWKVTGPEGNAQIMPTDAELADFAEGVTARARGLSAVDAEALRYARERQAFHAAEAERLTDPNAKTHARSLADEYAQEAERLSSPDHARAQELRRRIADNERRASTAVDSDEREFARAIADEYRADLAEIENGPHHSRTQPRDAAGQYAGPPRAGSATDRALDVLGIPKAAMASIDLSAPGRQGTIFLLTEPKASAGAFKDMLRAVSAKGHTRVVEEIAAHPKFDLARKSELFLANFGPGEEVFGPSAWSRRIPGVKVSERTFETFLDSQRLRVFSDFADEFAERGMTYATHPQEYKDLARVINTREENAAGALEEAFGRYSADMRGDTFNLANLEAQRNATRLGAASGRLSGANQAVNSRVPWWQQFLNNAGQGAGAAAMGGAKDGGDLSPYLGSPVLVGEEGPEPVVTPDGRASVVGTRGPEKIVPFEPMTVVPSGRVSLNFEGAREKRRLREEAARYSAKPAAPSVWWHDPEAPVRVSAARR